jgi:hypothetical protein
MPAPLMVSKLPVALRSGMAQELEDFISTIRTASKDLERTTSSRIGKVGMAVQLVGKLIVCAEQMPVQQPPLAESTGKELDEQCDQEQRAQHQINQSATRTSIEFGEGNYQDYIDAGSEREGLPRCLASDSGPSGRATRCGHGHAGSLHIEIAGEPIKLGGFVHVPRELPGGSHRVAFFVTLPAREKKRVHHYDCTLDRLDANNPVHYPQFITLDIDPESVESRALGLARIFRIRIVATISFTVTTASGKSNYILEAIENRSEIFACLRQFEQDLGALPGHGQGEQLLL